MLYRNYIVSTRTLLQLATAMMFFVGGAGGALGANSGVAPVLVPYTITSLAGNAISTVGGFGGEGGLGAKSTLSSPQAIAVDSVGNVYVADTSNAIIREINAQTGLISTVAGNFPTACVGTVCSKTNSGCADGVAALRSGIGGAIHGLAVDGYGNIYFSDGTAQTISVIYRGGAQVANFIALEDPTAAPTASAVLPGYVYHVAGTINLASCAATVGNLDNVLAFQGGTFSNPGQIGLDSAGNIYVLDIGNSSLRVINTQATTQTFFQTSVPPGFVRAIANCSASLTVSCPVVQTTTQGTGIGGPANAATFSAGLKAMTVDAYGNTYELNGSGAPIIYGGVAYAGGAPLAHLINLESGLTATYGNFYDVINSITAPAPALPSSWPATLANAENNLSIRSTSIAVDSLGNLYFLDTHWPELERIDVNSQVATDIVGSTGQRGANGLTSTVTSPTNPVYCVYGTTAAPFTQGPVTFDPKGDGCPAILGSISGNFQVVADGPGNVYLADGSNQLVRKLPAGNMFPVTPIATPVTQPIQVHFDASNPPVQIGVAPTITTSSFAIAPGIPDFTINTTTPEFAMGTLGAGSYKATNLVLVSGIPTCAALASGVSDPSLDCLVYVTFTPTAPGVRQAQLVATTQNGSIYNIALSGVGSGGKLAVDGGLQANFKPNGLVLGNTAGIAVSQSGTVYTADPANNRIVVQATSATGAPGAPAGSATTIGTGLSGPMGVAVDAANNVYISDTGNNRILEVNPITGVQTVLGAVLAVGSPAYPQYTFKAPQGLAVDSLGNVYVADTGNATVVEIPNFPALGGATPLLSYPGAPTFVTPVAVAVDSKGNVYVADQGNPANQIVVIPAGGGDLVTIPGSSLPLVGGSGITTPNGVAVDGAGNVYISDSGTNTVWEAPAAGPPNGVPFTLNFSGLNSPAGLALDANGNLYVADSGNSQILFDNRQNPLVSFGTVPQSLAAPSGVAGTPSGCPINGNSTPCSGVLTVTNIGNLPVTLNSPFAAVTSTTPASDNAFQVSDTCLKPGTPTLLSGAACTILPTFYPTSDGPQTASVSVNGVAQSLSLVANAQANGEQPLANIVLSTAYSAGGLAAGQTATVTATVNSHITGNTPIGPIAFSYTIAGDGTTGAQTVPLASTVAGTSTASLVLPTLLQGRRYTVNATYTGDVVNSLTVAAPISFYVPGAQVTVTATSVTYAYGQPVPAITGTVTGITDPSVKYTFVTAATPSSPTGLYPITVVFSGGTHLNYGFPDVLTSTGARAVVTETPAPLTVVVPAYTTAYGAADINYFPQIVITGAVNGDLNRFSATFTPPNSSILDPGTQPVIATLGGKPVKNYTVSITNGTITVTAAPTAIGVTAAKTAILTTALSSGTISIAVTTSVSGGKGTPSGTITLSDNFVPVIDGAPGIGTPVPPCSATVTTNCNTPLVLPLVLGAATYLPTSPTPGTHYYSVAYSGDKDFQASTTLNTTNLLIDNADFTLTSTTGVVAIIPGIVPSGSGLPPAANQSASTPETALISINSVLAETGVVTLTCQTQNPSYVNCTMTPPQVTLATGATTACTTAGVCTSVLSISTPATLPLGFFNTGEMRSSGAKTVLAFLPLGILAFCVRRRRRLSKALWLLLAIAAVSAGMSGCGTNKVDFFTPVPQGPQTVTVTASATSITTSKVVTRTFVVPISID